MVIIETMERRNPDPPIEKLVPTQQEKTADPTEIFPQVKKTPKMLKVEQIIQEDLQVFLPRKYSQEDLSTPDISEMITEISGGNIKVREQTINNWLRKFNSQVRPRSEAVKLAWQNPEKRERRAEAIYSTATKRKIDDGMSNWQSLFSESEKRNRARGAMVRRKRALLRSMRETLGEDPTERPNEMYSQQGLLSTEIAQEPGIHYDTLISWIRKLEIEITKARETPYGYIRGNKEEKQNLVEEARAQNLVQNLDPKEQYVINHRYPAEGRRSSSTKIVEELGLARRQVWQIEKRALGKLRVLVNSQPSGLPVSF